MCPFSTGEMQFHLLKNEMVILNYKRQNYIQNCSSIKDILTFSNVFKLPPRKKKLKDGVINIE